MFRKSPVFLFAEEKVIWLQDGSYLGFRIPFIISEITQTCLYGPAQSWFLVGKYRIMRHISVAIYILFIYVSMLSPKCCVHNSSLRTSLMLESQRAPCTVITSVLSPDKQQTCLALITVAKKKKKFFKELHTDHSNFCNCELFLCWSAVIKTTTTLWNNYVFCCYILVGDASRLIIIYTTKDICAEFTTIHLWSSQPRCILMPSISMIF